MEKIDPSDQDDTGNLIACEEITSYQGLLFALLEETLFQDDDIKLSRIILRHWPLCKRPRYELNFPYCRGPLLMNFEHVWDILVRCLSSFRRSFLYTTVHCTVPRAPSKP